ncbi:unnamed protein product [Dicrocoelium dendriticum]|nr:unnamed protein product [Dicrocoelium dendriticum]
MAVSKRTLNSFTCDSKRVPKHVFKQLRDATPEPGKEDEFDMVQRPLKEEFDFKEFMRNLEDRHYSDQVKLVSKV